MEWYWWVIMALGYFATAGATASLTAMQFEVEGFKRKEGEESVPLLVGIIWPFGLPFVLVMIASYRYRKDARDERAKEETRTQERNGAVQKTQGG